MACFFDSAVPETPPRNCSAVVVNSTAISLSWIVPLVPNGPIVNYNVSYRPIQSRSGIDYTASGLAFVANTTNNSTTTSIGQLFEATSYSFTITAFTMAGPSPASSDQCVASTNEDGESSMQRKDTLFLNSNKRILNSNCFYAITCNDCCVHVCVCVCVCVYACVSMCNNNEEVLCPSSSSR